MKKVMVLMLIFGLVSIVQAGAITSVIFSDNYDRPDNTDIDASSTGMSGTQSPIVYQEAFEGSGAATSIQILSNELNIAVGAGMSSLYLDYNFTDTAILSADGFSVSLDVVSITTADDEANRFGGFGVGNTQAEATAAADCFDMDAPFRPNLARANQGFGVSDFYADLALDQNLRLWSNGALLNTINVGAATGTITVDFFMSDFNAGSTVTAIVYFNGVQQDIQTFAWDNTNANYIGISGRTAGAGVFLDNLSIASIVDDKANTPNPANGDDSLDPATIVLSWNKGKDASGNPNADISQHYLYISTGEPNFISPVTVADTADPITYNGYTFTEDVVYYWRVDESINGSLATDPETITGHTWSFDTLTFPEITGQPITVVRYPYTDPGYEGSAVFECQFDSVTPLTMVKWFKEAGETDVEVDDSDEDISIVTTSVGGDSYTSILTIADVEEADEGGYYCQIVNDSGLTNAAVSDTAGLGVKRQVAHWTLDEADLVGGQYQDISGEGNHADPNIVPGSVSFIDGVDPTETGDGLDLTVEPLAAADSGDWAPSMYTGEITVSAWLNWSGPNGSWQGVVSNRVGPPPAAHNFYIEIRQDNDNLQIGGVPNVGDLQIAPLPIGEWVHLAITARAGEVVMYVNGESVATNTAGQAVTQNLVPLYIGALGRASSGVINTFNGEMDDVQLYNYAMTAEEIIYNFYYAVLEESICLYPDALDVANAETGLDVDDVEFTGGDCLVTIDDFAVFASHWLGCGLYPESECP